MKITEDMQFCQHVPTKPNLVERLKCLFGRHAWEYYGTFNDEFNLDDITNERICIFCNRHETEVDFKNSIWKKAT